METIAVYREEHVKVYGITGKNRLALGILRIPTAKIEQCGLVIAHLEDGPSQFELVTCNTAEGKMIEMHLIFEQKMAKLVSKIIKQWPTFDLYSEFRLLQPVDLLYLHGPHFQDRFGIVDIAFASLLAGNIDILVSGCAGTSMYLAIPADQGAPGMRILKDTFLIPTSV